MSYQDAAVEARQEADNMASTSHNMATYEPEDLKEITGDYTHVLGRDGALYKEEEALDTEAALDQELCAFRGSSQGTKSIYQDAAEARQEADNMASMSHNMATYGPEELKEITGNYTHVLGRGGYGVVYKGTCKDGKEIAVKVLHERPGDKMDTEFNSELELIRKLVHKNIIRLVGYCYKKESEYNSARGAALCFEYAPNGSLRRYISDGDDGPDWCTRYSIIKGICEGLRYLHHHPSECFIYHLDLKPENILLGDDMVPKIADFGLSRLYSDHATRITGSNRAVTVRYAPHEFRLKGITSTTFDIYSLGVLIIEIVRGPETYDKTYDTEKEEIIEHVCKRWISKLDETHLHQVRRCLEIALRCSDTVRRNRPEISNVIQELFDPENMITIEKSVCQESICNQGSETGKVDSGAIWQCMGTNPSRRPGMSTPKVKRRVGKYELGLTIGKGTFGKVKFAMNVETAEAVAIKILDKEKLLEHKMVGQVEQAIATMKLIKHPNVVHIHEGKILILIKSTFSSISGDGKQNKYIVLELVNGGELFDKIVNYGRMSEDEARRCFQQLINAVDYCHSRGVYHRNLKPENLLLDNRGNLKVSDFWSSALPHQLKGDGLLHTTCGTPNYVAPEVLEDQGYDGAMADFWSCGVILFVLLAGYLPFEDSNITALYKKISNAQFTCPPWTSFPAKRLLTRILDPNPMTRIKIQEIFEDEWFKKGYERPQFDERYCITLDDVDAAFNDLGEHHETEQKEEPVALNAFELISMSAGLDLGNFFNCELDFQKERRFASKLPPKEIIRKIEETAKPLGFNIHKTNYKLRLENVKAGRKGNLSVAIEVLQVGPSLHMVEVREVKGDTLEFHQFFKNLSNTLKDTDWKSDDLLSKSS